MTEKTAVVPVIHRIPPVAPLILGVLMLLSGGYIWFSRPARPVGMEGNVRPIAFSLGLSGEPVSHIDRQGISAFWAGSGRILQNGYAAGAAGIWPEFERSAPDKTLVPVKIIPSGGLYPYSLSDSFAGEIKAFVQKGGSVICLGQPLGSMFRALPGSPKAVGWAELAEDVTSSMGRVRVSMDHPVLAPLGRSEFTARFGGFFTEVPGGERLQVLLRDVDTGRAVLVAYRYGAGLVIACTLVGDAAGNLGDEEKVLFDQVLRWAQSGGADMALYEAGDSTDMVYEFKGDAGSGRDGMVELYSPAGTLESAFPVELPDSGSQVVKPFVMSEPRGIWRMVTYRRGADGKLAGPQSVVWFAVGHAPIEATPGGFRCTISVPGPYLPADSIVPVLVHLWNDGTAPIEIVCKGPAGKRTAKLAAGQYLPLRDEVALSGEGTHNLDYEFYSVSDGKKLAALKRRVETGHPDRVFLVAKAARSVSAGQTVPVALRAYSVNPGRYDADCTVRLSLGGKTVWQDTRKYKLYGAGYSEETVKVPVPAGLRGVFVLETVLTYRGKELTRAWAELETAQ